MLRFGYTRGVPEEVETAWGCRAIAEQDGTVVVVWDRASAVGPETEALLEYLASLPLDGGWEQRAMELLRAGVMDLRLDEEFVLCADEVVVIKGNTLASTGYLYVCAYFQPTAANRQAVDPAPGHALRAGEVVQ